MLTVTAEGVDAALTFDGLVDTLREAFRAGAVQPVRHHHSIERASGAASTLLLMPAWTDFRVAGVVDGHIGVKVVTVSPDNNTLRKPAVAGLYLLLDGRTGEPQAMIDGPRLTQWRTACASALAATYLAREDASRLLVVGAGALAPFLARAHAAVRPIESVAVWNRTPANAEKVAEGLRADGFAAKAVGDLDAAVGLADIVSCATISSEPLISGQLNAVKGSLDILGKNFKLARGAVTFGGGAVSNPLLDIMLTTQTPALMANISIVGTVRKMQLILSSDPEMPRDEILAQILFGKSASA